MTISMDTYRELYKKIDAVSPVPFDCGTLCEKACCGVKDYDRAVAEDSMGIYLYEGEAELLKEEPDWLEWGRETVSEEDYFPESFVGREVYFVRCKNPLECNREYRPLQCRIFPVSPHLVHPGAENEHLILIWNDLDLPYTCPLLEEETALSTEWLKAVYEVFDVLLEDPLHRDMVRMDSEDRLIEVGPPTALYPRPTAHG